MVYSIWQHRYQSIYYREPTVPNPFRYDHHTNHVVRTAYLEPTARIGGRTEHDAVGACVASRSVSDHTVAEGVRVAGILYARRSPNG